MNRILVWQLALRYLRGKRSANAVPILSRISMVAIAVGSCAMIILFSVFNGFEHVVEDLYKAFYPEIKITASKGKFLSISDTQVNNIKSIEGVGKISFVIEDNVLVNSNSNEMIATLKGIDGNYFEVNNVKPYIVAGRDSVSAGDRPTAIVGAHIQALMELDVNTLFDRIMITYPNAKHNGPILDPSSAFQTLDLKPDGVFRIQDDFDGKYILAALPLVQTLLQQEGKYSSIELSLKPHTDADQIKRSLQQVLGTSYHVETRYEQNKALYMVMRTEKWAVYVILLLVLLIASFNMVGALALLVLEKQKDIAILRAMGAMPADIRRIFITEGVLWSLTGGLIGIAIGTLLCLGQQYFHWIRLEGAFIIDAYPVSMLWTDFVLVIVTVVVVGFLAAWYPAMRATKVEAPTLKSA